MEGRLLPPSPGRFQSFPRDRWADEFGLASLVPLDYIEWIYDAFGADVNPLMHSPHTIVELAGSTGVAVRSLCADYFMDFPFVRCSEPERLERQSVLANLISISGKIGISRIVIPFVDSSRIDGPSDEDQVIRVLEEALPVARASQVELHLETSLNPAAFSALLEMVDDPLVKVNYDSGNSASLGYRPREEFAAYGWRIGSVHIKDRRLGGSTVPLGTGDCDFPELFLALAPSHIRETLHFRSHAEYLEPKSLGYVNAVPLWNAIGR